MKEDRRAEYGNVNPEIELSLEIRDACERLLNEKGRNELAPHELIMQIYQPIGIIRSLITRRMPQDLLRDRVVLLKKINSQSHLPDAKLMCEGPNPSKSKKITIHIPSLDISPADKVWLELERNKEGKIVVFHPLNYQFFGRDPNTSKKMEVRMATMEELEIYKRHIKESSPIENK